VWREKIFVAVESITDATSHDTAAWLLQGHVVCGSTHAEAGGAEGADGLSESDERLDSEDEDKDNLEDNLEDDDEDGLKVDKVDDGLDDGLVDEIAL
jgi:hypothetical protein